MTARCTYVLPLRRTDATDAELAELAEYVRGLVAAGCEVLVVDGSPARHFGRHAAALGAARHVPVDPRWRFLNGKVNGVLTGMEQSACERVILADDDVRYTRADVDRMCGLLDRFDLVVPQNYFVTMPWWARVETARTLLNRAVRAAGDFPGTFGVRRATFMRIGPYDGDVLFENEAMRRHFLRHGTRVRHARDFLVARRAPTLAKWREQRLRQAYEDLDFPLKTALFLALLPTAALLAVWNGTWAAAFVGAVMLVAVALAAAGRRDGASAVIPFAICLLAPLWVLERSVMVYAALRARTRGGCVYGGRLIARGMA
jgi:hypothetical protein